MASVSAGSHMLRHCDLKDLSRTDVESNPLPFNHRQFLFRLPKEEWPGRAGLGGWFYNEMVYLLEGHITML